MRFCTNRGCPSWRWWGLLLALTAALRGDDCSPRPDQATTPAPTEVRPAPIAISLTLPELALQLASPWEATPSPEGWVAALRMMHEETPREVIRKAISKRIPFPRAQLVRLLEHPELAVRIAALELLESATGQDMLFNPWSPTMENGTALERWKSWAAGTEAVTLALPKLTPERTQALFQEVLSGQREREERALRALEEHDLEAVRLAEAFLTSHPDLDVASQAKLKAAQYRFLLMPLAREEAPLLSKQLVFGNRDQQLTSLGRLKKLGSMSLPIVRDFVTKRDPLVRETAVEVFLGLGAQPALELLKADLQREKDLNVLQAAIRQLGDLASDTALQLLLVWAHHPDEDIVVDALNTLSKMGFTGQRGSSSRQKGIGIKSKDTKVGPTLLNQLLKDDRWRVRHAALECVTKLSLRDCTEAVRTLLVDPDEFVRAAAVRACSALNDATGLKQLETMYLADPKMTGPVLAAWISNSTKLPPTALETLMKRDAEAVLPLFSALGSNSKAAAIVMKLREHSDPDVVQSAWRALAQHHADETGVPEILQQALHAGTPAVRKIILDNLSLGGSNSSRREAYWKKIGLAPKVTKTNAGKERKTSLDPLYDGFLLPLRTSLPKAAGDEAKSLAVADQTLWPPLDNAESDADSAPLRQSLLNLMSRSQPQDEALRAALLLVGMGGNKRVAQFLIDAFPSLSVPLRAKIADDIPASLHPVYWPLLKLALTDSDAQVRKQALQTAFYSEDSSGLFRLTLELASEPEAKLTAADLYGNSLLSAARSGDSQATVVDWAHTVLGQVKAAEDLRMLALILLAEASSLPTEQELLPLLETNNFWQRRTVLWALHENSHAAFMKVAERFVSDPAAPVRAAVAALTGGYYGGWTHHLNDRQSDFRAEELGIKVAPTKDAIARLNAFLNDAAPEVKFAAAYGLLALGESVDLRMLGLLARQQVESVHAPTKLGNFLHSFHQALPQSAHRLVAFADLDSLDSDKSALVRRHFQSAVSTALTFTELAPQTAASAKLEPVPEDTPPEPIPAPPSATGPFTAIYFYSPGCPECARVSEWLEKLQGKFPHLQLERCNIRETPQLVRNQALCLRAGVPARSQNLTPAIFTQTGYLVREDLQPERLEQLLRSASVAVQDPQWAELDERGTAAAAAAVEERFQSFSPGMVLAGGLLDGINPCAFATIIFLLSYLKIARRSPREILLVGGSFILAVFLTYFAIGLLLNEAIGWVANLSWARKLLNWIFAGFALLVALLSFRDAWRAFQGQLADMSLQMPSFLKERVRSIVRTGARSSRFVIAAFITGIVITFLELACTGQVYAPIIYAIHQGSTSAVGYLLLYNLAFIAPLILIFALAYRGMQSDRLVQFQAKYTGWIKLGMALLFLGLGLVLVWSA